MENKKYCWTLVENAFFLVGTGTIEGTLKSAFNVAEERHFKDGELMVRVGEIGTDNIVVKIKEFKLNRKGKMIL